MWGLVGFLPFASDRKIDVCWSDKGLFAHDFFMKLPSGATGTSKYRAIVSEGRELAGDPAREHYSYVRDKIDAQSSQFRVAVLLGAPIFSSRRFQYCELGVNFVFEVDRTLAWRFEIVVCAWSRILVRSVFRTVNPRCALGSNSIQCWAALHFS